MEGLMHVCNNWGTADCYPEVSDLKYAKKINDGEGIPIWPVGKKLRRLDEICKECESRFFVCDEEKCPICDSTNVERTGGFHDSPGMATAYGFRCNNCEEKFWIYESSLKK